jgi:hypothetical protein
MKLMALRNYPFLIMMDYDDRKKKSCSSMNTFAAIEDASPKAKDFFIKLTSSVVTKRC